AQIALARVHDDAAGVRRVLADEALHERALPRPVLAEQRVERAGGHAERHVVERDERAEALRQADDFDLERALAHPRPLSVSSRSSDRATAPKTPTCIVIILIAAWLLPYSV